ncbi:SMI1/KNR4 family protein [Amycolatopsis rhabdoformis]|uniref:SMI1/KNR4 family protein n=1 Tax=Amycolatopsis rhabdoformis TaxID=1448059 RepID=A0ABZ1IG91_9PSEU|nr:SMI1/KNR4 family protein [Amycolatopsis rhabdoformis]WSE33118.1 SMI1/KNR4 family protein [Amycolatopsis rhabdoformis]
MTWGGVRARVELVARSPRAEFVFGADKHGFRLARPLRERDVTAIEEQFGARLPAAYRSFLLEVGACGAGPGYGLLGFRRHRRRWMFGEGDLRGGDRVNLRPEFAHTEAFLLAEWPDFRTVPGTDRTALAASLEDRDHAATHGTLPLSPGDNGCRDLLVVTGPDRGAVWRDAHALDQALSPYDEIRASRQFDRWYLDWLDGVEARVGLARRSGGRPGSAW